MHKVLWVLKSVLKPIMNPTRAGHWGRSVAYIVMECLGECQASPILYFCHPPPFQSSDRHCILQCRKLDVVSAAPGPIGVDLAISVA
jgi:hypothetical protein